MFKEYRETVFAAYKKKEEQEDLSINLQHLKPSKLRDESQIVYHERPLPKDDDTIRSFFGSKGEKNDYEQNINNFNIEKFKPLIKYLNGETAITDDKNIELLAWLIDFNPRPYAAWKKKNVSDNESSEKVIDVSSTTVEVFDTQVKDDDVDHISEKEEDEDDNGKLWGIKSLLLDITILLVVLCFLYILRPRCMYWDGDQYQTIACEQRADGIVIVNLDTFRLAHLKRIKNPESIKLRDIGKVHYSTIAGVPEFYTMGGENPTDTAKRLLPLSRGMYEKYINKK